MHDSAELRIGVIGAGYIAAWHADAIKATRGVQLAAVCDASSHARDNFARTHNVRSFSHLDELLESGFCHAVHILTPPHVHCDLAVKCLQAGLHVFVEKPVALSSMELETVFDIAAARSRHVGVGHNFLFLPSYSRLKRMKEQGELGLVSSAQINWSLPLAPLRCGPYNTWFLRETRNLLLELGPHPFSFAADLIGPLEIEHVSLGQWITLPGGEQRPQSWRIVARSGNVDVSINIAMVETIDDRSVTLRGSSAIATLDYAADTLVVSGDNTADLVANAFLKGISKAASHARESGRNAFRQASSLNQLNPYGLSFRSAISTFYSGIRNGVIDRRLSLELSRHVMGSMEASIAKIPTISSAYPIPNGKSHPNVLVIGGTGFIGRHLTRRLVEIGFDVRVLSRSTVGPFSDLGNHVEMMGASLRDEAQLGRAMNGIDFVFNLAKSTDRTWDSALENDISTATAIAHTALKAKVQRLIYTGTIASYDMSKSDKQITEALPFGEMSSRNLYARSKAECERQLMEMHHRSDLPLVIARPGIVVGAGGPLQHWGLGRWHGPGAVRLWGNGHNILPFVLVDDVCNALIAMMHCSEAVGEAFNLIGEPMLTGRDYFDEIHKRTGAKLKISSSNFVALWLADRAKFLLKHYGLRQREALCFSLADWKSRGHLSTFDNNKAKRLLGWQPEDCRETFLRRAIDDVHLFW